MEQVEINSIVLVLNSSYEPLHFTNWKRAIVLIFKNKAKIISKTVIRLVNYVRIPFNSGNSLQPKKNLIHKRDNHQCQYCGSIKNLTIDHVIPKSKNGKNTWDNMVTCCLKCNLKKGDKLLSETDMVLYKKPYSPLNKMHLELKHKKDSEWNKFLIG